MYKFMIIYRSINLHTNYVMTLYSIHAYIKQHKYINARKVGFTILYTNVLHLYDLNFAYL